MQFKDYAPARFFLFSIGSSAAIILGSGVQRDGIMEESLPSGNRTWQWKVIAIFGCRLKGKISEVVRLPAFFSCAHAFSPMRIAKLVNENRN